MKYCPNVYFGEFLYIILAILKYQNIKILKYLRKRSPEFISLEVFIKPVSI
uniref:Uncharacterized protein n=1 Tax=Octopus bimaculoides TaxID=37653 RepID=A0A0L8GGL1_OCTBM